MQKEARARFDAGLTALDAARDIALADYDSWGDAERIAVNVATRYREFEGDDAPADVVALFAAMEQLWKDRAKSRAGRTSPSTGSG